MSEAIVNGVPEATTLVNELNIQSKEFDPLSNSSKIREYETPDEIATTDSDEYLSEPLRYQSFQYSTTTDISTVTLTPNSNETEENDNFVSCLNGMSFDNIEIPIVGYEVMEERARFTVFKLRVENKMSNDCWFVFRRYTDFVRLCNKLRKSYPNIVQHLPRKRWLGNNFDPIFLEERVNGLQTLVNSILSTSELINLQYVQDFFCLNEPPAISDVNLESRAMFEAFEDTIYDLQRQLKEKEAIIDSLQDSLHSKVIENDNLKKIIKNSTANCQKCKKGYEAISNSYHINGSASFNNLRASSPVSSTLSDP